MSLLLKVFKKIGREHNLLNYKSTADFIHLIHCWWSIVNVKTPFKGLHLNNEFKKPILTMTSVNISFLNKFLLWLDTCKAKICTTGTLIALKN